MANLFSKLFNFGKSKDSVVLMTAELESLTLFEKNLNELLKRDAFIARSDYKELRDNNFQIYSRFKVHKDSQTLRYYCQEHRIDEKRITRFLSIFEDLSKEDGACRDGYLIVKEGKDEPFLGCTNYKADKSGCNCYMTKQYYLKNIKENRL